MILPMGLNKSQFQHDVCTFVFTQPLDEHVHKRIICFCHVEKKNIELEVKDAGGIIDWEFFSKNKDIGFSASYITSEETIEVCRI